MPSVISWGLEKVVDRWENGMENYNPPMRVDGFIVSCALTSLVLSACGGAPPAELASEIPDTSDAASGAELAADLDERIPDWLDDVGVPGLAVAVVDGSQIVYDGAFGVADRDNGAPVTSDTVFSAASLAKPLFAWRVHELVRLGELELDRPLSDYVDRPWVDDPRLAEITARRVLSHTSGFPNWRQGRWDPDPQPLTIDFEPGSRFSYSGEGYMYLQAAVVAVTGHLLEPEMSETVFTPLGMSASSFLWRDDYDRSAAIGHGRDGDPQPEARISDAVRRDRVLAPLETYAAGGLHATASDYARFLVAFMNDRPRAETMLTPTSNVEPGLDWGLGWGIETVGDQRLFWHWGDNDVFKAMTFGDLDAGRAVVCLTNSMAGHGACRPIVEAVFPGEHPALDFRMVNY
ncbi:MAG TPA: serine hydrolase [Acidobacteria bacterium]|nr:serine hydrolase [Acidobacteriota bacterium]